MKNAIARSSGAALVLALGCCSPVSSEEVEKFVEYTPSFIEKLKRRGRDETGYVRINSYSFNTKSIDDFINFMNNVNWSDGANRYFYNPRNCVWGGISFDVEDRQCNADMEERSVIGTRKCANVIVFYKPQKNPYEYINFRYEDVLSSRRNHSWGQRYSNNDPDRTCTKWKEVATERIDTLTDFPVSTKEKTSEPPETQNHRNETITFIMGFVLGAIVSRIITVFRLK